VAPREEWNEELNRMMKQTLSAALLSSLIVGACATGATPAATDPGLDETRWRGDPRLYHMLLPYPLTQEQMDSVQAYGMAHGTATDYLLAEAAEDERAPVVVRVNALFLLAERRADTHIHVFRNALDAEDVRVRASAAAAMRHFAVTHPREAVGIARMALFDPEPDVQAQALQVLGDTDIDLLRAYVRRAPDAELRAVAEDLVQLAEQRGAPLTPDPETGVLSRDTPDGFRITFTPERHWPQWGAGVGSVRIERDGAVLQTIDRVEAVAGVIPVFLSPDGRHVVFERERSIVVRAMRDGTERPVGPGIAPRPRPFTDEFVFLREQGDGSTERREETELTYDVFSAPFDPPDAIAPIHLGSTTATVSFGRFGAYSPVRWMKVEERSGSFYLTSSHMKIVSLPDPFG
jgi:hypothetical protein